MNGIKIGMMFLLMGFTFWVCGCGTSDDDSTDEMGGVVDGSTSSGNLLSKRCSAYSHATMCSLGVPCSRGTARHRSPHLCVGAAGRATRRYRRCGECGWKRNRQANLHGENAAGRASSGCRPSSTHHGLDQRRRREQLKAVVSCQLPVGWALPTISLFGADKSP